MSNYPEYLNPFAEEVKPKPKLTLRSSFKDFKRTMRQSFRMKKKDQEEVTIRQKPDAFRRLPVSYPTSEPLPRSRFHERISHNPLKGPNPFDEDDDSMESKSVTIRRKGKKRAPLPPKSLSSQNINDEHLQIPSGCSTWSLTSADTDYSEYRMEASDLESRPDMLEDFQDFNKEMEKLKDDSNNNVVKDDGDARAPIVVPDLVISCPNEDTETQTEDTEAQTEDTETQTKDTEDECTKSEASDLVVNHIKSSEEKTGAEDEKSEKNKDENVEKNEGESVQRNENEEFLFHEKKSLYIAGSRDELNDSEAYTGRVSLYISGSCDDLDASNNNDVCNKSVIDENSNDDEVPIPKQRKNKLSKNVLLGV